MAKQAKKRPRPSARTTPSPAATSREECSAVKIIKPPKAAAGRDKQDERNKSKAAPAAKTGGGKERRPSVKKTKDGDHHQRQQQQRKQRTQNQETQEDWIASLAARSAAASSAVRSGGGGGGGARARKNDPSRRTASASSTSASVPASSEPAIPSKTERMQRREAKKRRREERLAARAEAKRLKRPQAQRGGGTVGGAEGWCRPSKAGAAEAGGRGGDRGDATMLALSAALRRSFEAIHPPAADDGDDDRRRHRPPKPYVDPTASFRGKSTRSTPSTKLDSTNLQPRPRDYGGLGLARPSLYLPLRDPSFVPKFEQEFGEHVEGFYGKQRTKAMKRQLDGGMLWRRLLEGKKERTAGGDDDDDDEKGGGGGGAKKRSKADRWGDAKVDGRRLVDMSPDERVEAMIRAGMI